MESVLSILYIILFFICLIIDLLIVVYAIKGIIFYFRGQCKKDIIEKNGKKYIRTYGKPRCSNWGEVIIREIKDEANKKEEKI